MLKHIAIFQALDISTLGIDAYQLKRAKYLSRRSPILESEAQAAKWIEETKKMYPENGYKVYHCIISFKESERENVEAVLGNLMKLF